MPCLQRPVKQKKCLTVFELNNNSYFELIRLAGVQYAYSYTSSVPVWRVMGQLLPCRVHIC
jgi:hypothetical protein